MRRQLRLLAVALFLLTVFALFELTGMRDHVTLAFVREQIQAHPLGGVFLFMALFALGNLIQIPGWLFLAAAVLALGRTWGGMATYVAAVFACVASFLIVRLIGGNALRYMNNRSVSHLLAHLDARPIRAVMLSRLIFQTLPALNYTLAISGVKFRDYLIGTHLGLPVPILLYVVFFDYLETLLGLR